MKNKKAFLCKLLVHLPLPDNINISNDDHLPPNLSFQLPFRDIFPGVKLFFFGAETPPYPRSRIRVPPPPWLKVIEY